MERAGLGPVICRAGISGVTPDYIQQVFFFFFGSISIKVMEGEEGEGAVSDDVMLNVLFR